MCEPVKASPVRLQGLELTGVVWPLAGVAGVVAVGWVVVHTFTVAAIALSMLAAIATVVITVRSMHAAMQVQAQRKRPVRPAERVRPATRHAVRPVTVDAWVSDLRQERKRQLQIEAERLAQVETARVPVLEPSRVWTAAEVEQAREVNRR